MDSKRGTASFTYSEPFRVLPPMSPSRLPGRVRLCTSCNQRNCCEDDPLLGLGYHWRRWQGSLRVLTGAAVGVLGLADRRAPSQRGGIAQQRFPLVATADSSAPARHQSVDELAAQRRALSAAGRSAVGDLSFAHWLNPRNCSTRCERALSL